MLQVRGRHKRARAQHVKRTVCCVHKADFRHNHKALCRTRQIGMVWTLKKQLGSVLTGGGASEGE